MALGSTQPLK